MVNAGSSDDLKSKVEKISGKTLDINQFLVSIIGVKPNNEEKTSINKDDAVKITYHDPCHLKKSLGVSAEPRMLITANKGYSFSEMPEADWCCGMGGSFNLQYYEISADIGKRKIGNIKTSGADVVATGCPACMIQISDMLSKSNEKIAVKHPIEIYAESLKKDITYDPCHVGYEYALIRINPSFVHRLRTSNRFDVRYSIFGFIHPRSFSKKSFPLSSTIINAGKSFMVIMNMASMPSSGYSTVSILVIHSFPSLAAGPPIEPR